VKYFAESDKILSNTLKEPSLIQIMMFRFSSLSEAAIALEFEGHLRLHRLFAKAAVLSTQ
jgi:hypothetical protein